MIQSEANVLYPPSARTTRCHLDRIPDLHCGPELPRSSANIPLLPRNSLNNLIVVNPTRHRKAELAA